MHGHIPNSFHSRNASELIHIRRQQQQQQKHLKHNETNTYLKEANQT